MMNERWTEKYRPKTLNEVVGHGSIIRTLQAGINNREINNLIFYGEPGTGKTTTALALARDFFGENWKMAFYRTNAADYVGIDAIRKKIIPTIRCMPIIPVPFKIIFLDQADSITPKAQELLCIPMEKTPNVRFILSCNNISKIIDPIVVSLSLCTVYEFKPINKADIVKRLQYIAKKEGLTINMQQLGAIAEMCKGDLRKAIINLRMSDIPSKTDKQAFDLLV